MHVLLLLAVASCVSVKLLNETDINAISKEQSAFNSEGGAFTSTRSTNARDVWNQCQRTVTFMTPEQQENHVRMERILRKGLKSINIVPFTSSSADDMSSLPLVTLYMPLMKRANKALQLVQHLESDRMHLKLCAKKLNVLTSVAGAYPATKFESVISLFAGIVQYLKARGVRFVRVDGKVQAIIDPVLARSDDDALAVVQRVNGELGRIVLEIQTGKSESPPKPTAKHQEPVRHESSNAAVANQRTKIQPVPTTHQPEANRTLPLQETPRATVSTASNSAMFAHSNAVQSVPATVPVRCQNSHCIASPGRRECRGNQRCRDACAPPSGTRRASSTTASSHSKTVVNAPMSSNLSPLEVLLAQIRAHSAQTHLKSTRLKSTRPLIVVGPTAPLPATASTSKAQPSEHVVRPGRALLLESMARKDKRKARDKAAAIRPFKASLSEALSSRKAKVSDGSATKRTRMERNGND